MSIPQLKGYIQKASESVKLNPQFVYSRHHIGNLVSHRAVGKEMKKVAMSSIPYVLNNGHPVTKWSCKPNPQNPIDRMQSCLYGAPIMIDDVKYLCLLTVKFNNITGKIFPYVVNIEDGNGMKVSDDISVLDNSDITTPSNSGTYMGTVTSQDSRTPSNSTAKVQQNIETEKDNNIKTEKYTYMNKKLIRLTESDLHRIVKESANKILKEYFNPNNDGTFKDMDDGSNYEVNGTYYDDDMEAIKKREKVMMDYCQQVIWGCHQQGILPELLKAMRAFEKKYDIDVVEHNYVPLNRVPIIHHNCSFSPSAERTPQY